MAEKKKAKPKTPTVKFKGELKEGRTVTIENHRYTVIGKNKLRSLQGAGEFKVTK